jgi:GT2 family glycosyltransferase
MLVHNQMKNLTAIIVTFLRDEYLFVCVESLLTQYPDINIIIGDQNPSKEKKKRFEVQGIRYVELEYDCGLCKARNELVKLVNTDYVLIGDDDFKYEEGAKVDEMLQIIDLNDQVDLIGGRIREGGQIKNYQGYIEEYNNHFVYLPLTNLEQVAQVDLTFNFFVAKTAAVKAVQWDEQIKVAYEHSSFFIDFKRAGYKAYFTPDSIVIHKPAINTPPRENHNKYKQFRSRRSDKKRFFEKYGIEYVIDMNGFRDTYDRSNVDEIDFIITVFERVECLENLLFSIAKYYPQANIFIADQSKKFIPKQYNDLYFRLFEAGLRVKPKAFGLKYDCGLSEARNHLFAQTDRKYKLLLEEDFVFTEKTDIPAMLELMESDPKLGIVGGLVIQDGNEIKFEHYLEKNGRTLRHVASGGYNDQEYKLTGCVPNFMLMRADLGVAWDDRIKISGEHTDFFLKLAETDWKVAYTRKSQVDHVKIQDKASQQMRQRDEFTKILFENHDIDKIVYVNGYTIEYDGEKIITHS